MTTPDPLWTPRPDAADRTQVGRYLSWLRERHGLSFAGYDELWQWSVSDLEGFWSSIWEYFEVRSTTPYEGVLTRRTMPGAGWFTGATLNYAEHMLRGATTAAEDRPVIFARSQTRPPFELTGTQFADQVARIRVGLRRLGVGRGDRVAAYLPNVPETLAAMLATASLGAVWSSCAPEFGTRSVLDRLRQIEPSVLLAVDGYRFGAKPVDRRDQVSVIRNGLPGVQTTVMLPYLFPEEPVLEGCSSWAELTTEAGSLEFDPVPFDHPLYILYSSGTTGPPKAIVHGHGGVLLEHLKSQALHHDLGPDDLHFWFSTTGWVVWNLMASALLTGSAVVTFDGDPEYPDLGTLWRIVAETGTTVLGVSAAFALGCRRAGLTPGAEFDLSRLRGVLSTGSALPPEGFRWFYDAVGQDLHMASTSGGTDVCGGFVGGSPLLPVRAGEIACRCLGCKVEAYDSAGRPVIGEQGELVVTEPMPSMPVGFWNDPGGERYRAAYFARFPGVWHHGDLITISEGGSSIISGRSDATLNRGGVRLGTSEFYSVVEARPEVLDSLVVHLEDPSGGAGELCLFLVLADGAPLNEPLRSQICAELRATLSPRHVPDTILAVASVPRTISGKKLEVPVKRILSGSPADQVATPGALANPDALAAFADLARERRSRRSAGQVSANAEEDQ